MKKVLFAALLLIPAARMQAAVKPVPVADTSVSTVSGVGGYVEVFYNFAKGDKITLNATSSKLLERAIVIMLPQNVLLRKKEIKKVAEDFVMPADGTVAIRFISDRGGVNNIHYSVVRLPASESVQNFNTQAPDSVTKSNQRP